MTPATLHIPKTNISIELTPELADMIAAAVEDYREMKSDELLSDAIRTNNGISAHADRIRSLHTT